MKDAFENYVIKKKKKEFTKKKTEITQPNGKGAFYIKNILLISYQ